MNSTYSFLFDHCHELFEREYTCESLPGSALNQVSISNERLRYSMRFVEFLTILPLCKLFWPHLVSRVYVRYLRVAACINLQINRAGYTMQ